MPSLTRLAITIAIGLSIFVSSCAHLASRAPGDVAGKKPGDHMCRLDYFKPEFTDTGKAESLVRSAEISAGFYRSIQPDTVFKFAGDEYSAEDLAVSAEALAAMARKYPPGSVAFATEVDRNFNVYGAGSACGWFFPAKNIFTGYYEPVIDGALQRSESAKWPVYALPKNIVEADLGQFSPRLAGERIKGRFDPAANRLVPYPARGEIEVLADALGLVPVAWIADPVERYFLHVQGSGLLRTTSGEFRRIHYAGSNGRKYRYLASLLIKEGKMTTGTMSMDSVKNYLSAADEPERERVMGYDESYVFFKLDPEPVRFNPASSSAEPEPVGDLGLPLTPGRSIATDRQLFPRGAVAFVETVLPSYDPETGRYGEKPFRGFVMNQDTGGAMRGPNRVDIFIGSGETAGKIAGNMKHDGRLYFLIKKK